MRLDNLNLSDQGEVDEDVLQFKDSERESVSSYFRLKQKAAKGSHNKLMDTPTRLLNMSNDFLPHTSFELQPRPGKEQELMTPRREFKILKDKLQTLVEKQPIQKLTPDHKQKIKNATKQ
jgi:hypothetical protein